MSRKARSRLRNVAEYVLVRAVETCLRCMPLRMALASGRAVGWLAHKVDRRHRRVAEQNAMWALGLDATAARRFVRRVYRNVGMTSVECVLLPALMRRRGGIEGLVTIEGGEHVREALAKGRGLIIVTAHIGNWEFSGLAAARLVGSVLSVARTLDNPMLDRYVRGVREQLGQWIVDRRGALRPVVRQLRDGGTVGMLIDQNQRAGGVFVPFFGRLASTVPSAASIALKYGVPVVPGYGLREKGGSHHTVRFEPAFDLVRTGDQDADVAANTAMFTRKIEEFIRNDPEQWFWLHSRWRRRPRAERDAAASPGDVRSES
jgi:KDO2-lipid IV(A) lauroyltransferase